MYRWIYGYLILLSLAPTMLAEKHDIKQHARDVEEQFDALQEEFTTVRGKALEAFQAENKSDEEKEKAYQEWSSQREKLASSIVALAKKENKHPATVDALIWVIQNVPESVNDKGSIRSQVVDILIRDYIRSNKLIALISQRSLAQAVDSSSERLLRALMTNSPTPKIQGLACLTLAESRDNLVQFLTRLRNHGTALRQFQEKELNGKNEYMVVLDKSAVAMASKQNIEHFGKESESLFQQVVNKYGKVTIEMQSNTITLSKIARDKLADLRTGIGKMAENIECVDLKGKKVRLSDYQGKVVVLDVWATWCGPCRAMIPHERELVKRLKGKPFAFISISIDADVKTLKEFLKKEPMPWIHWHNGAKEGVITRWRVDTIPAIFVLDTEGVIRYKDVRGEAMDEAVDALIKEAEGGSSEPPK